MLTQLNLPSFNTVLHNATAVFHNRLKLSGGVMNAIRLVVLTRAIDFELFSAMLTMFIIVCLCVLLSLLLCYFPFFPGCFCRYGLLCLH